MKKILNNLAGLLGLRVLKANDPRIANYGITGNFDNLVGAYSHFFIEGRGGRALPENKDRASILARGVGTPPSEAFFILEGLNKTRDLEGDVCEFGVAQGETSALIANEIRDSNKNLYLFDSFEGLPEPTEKDQLKDDIFNLGSMEAYKGTMSCPQDLVMARLTAIGFDEGRTKIRKGFVESDFATKNLLPESVSFAYVDFDFYEPILVVLQALHPRLHSGSVIVVDDYDFFSTGAKTAVDEFLQSHSGYTLEVPPKFLGHFCILVKD